MREQILALDKEGLSKAEIARRLGCNLSMVHRTLRDEWPRYDEGLRLAASSRLLLVVDDRILYSLNAPAGYTFLDLLLAAVYMSTSGQHGQPAPWWDNEKQEQAA